MSVEENKALVRRLVEAWNIARRATSEVTPVLSGFMECKSCQISVRKTTAAGTGTLRDKVIWEKAS